MQLFKNFCDYTLDKNGVLEKFELEIHNFTGVYRTS